MLRPALTLWLTCGPTRGAPGPFVWGEDVKAPSDLDGFLDCPIVLHRFPADWEGPCDPSFCKPGHRRNRGMNGGQSYCPAAGPRRNRRMLDEFEPTRGVAFIDKPLIESRGTLDMVSIAEDQGVEVAVDRVSLELTEFVEHGSLSSSCDG